MAARTKKARGKKTEKIPESMLGEEALQTRTRILDAAERVFAREGFDGARVDEIAAEADVNKALIYYYFESKKALLEELVNRAVKAIVAEKEAVFESTPAKIDLVKWEVPEEIIERGLSITSKWMAIFGILCVEAFKDDNEVPQLFRVMDNYLDSMAPILSKGGLEKSAVEEVRFPGVFFGLAPLLFFELLKDKWAAYYKVDRAALEKRFLGTFARMYGEGLRVMVQRPQGKGRGK